MSIGKKTCAAKRGRKGLSAVEREKTIVGHLPLVKHVLGRLSANLPAHVDRDDLLEAGMLGLINAADRFDTRRNVQFQTYAMTRIRGAMVDHLRNEDWLPRSVRSELSRINGAREKIEQANQRPATPDEIAARTGMRQRKYNRLTRMSAACSFCSLSEIPGGVLHEEEESDHLTHKAMPRPEDYAILAEDKERLTRAIEQLSKAERLVISLYYFEQLSLRAIAKMLRVTDSRVCQIHRGALKRLNRWLREPSFELVAASA